MKRLEILLLGLALLLTSTSAWAKLQVVATTPALASVAAEVGGKNVSVTSLALPTQDPHFVDAKPSLALTLAKADVLLSVGLDLEIGWLPTLITGSKNGKIQPGAGGFLECSQFVKILEVPTGTVDRSQGDVHPKGNPHYMYDPRQAARVVKGISDKLGKLDPAHAGEYKKNALALIKKLGASTRGWEKALVAAKGKKVVGYHKSFGYLANWLGLSIVEHVEPRPGIPPNPHHVTHVIDTMKKENVKALLQESYYPRKTSDLIAKEAGATVIQISGGPDFRAGKSYIAHIDAIVKQLARVYPK
jgi:zinc/manganese transport system substrate-binding protein